MSAGKDTINRHGSERCQLCVPQETCVFHGIEEFQRIAERRYYGRGFTVASQEDPADHIYVVCSGWLQMTHMTEAGKTVADLIGPGAIIGLASMMTGGRYLVTVRTLEESELEQVDREKFLTFLLNHPTAAVHALKWLSHYLQKSMNHLYEMASNVPAEKRLLRALCEISETCGHPTDGGIRIKVPLPVQVLADTIGCSRQWVSRLLRDLETQGFIRHKPGWITVTSAGFKKGT